MYLICLSEVLIITVYEKIINSKELLLDLIIDSTNKDKDISYNFCSFCSYHPLACTQINLGCRKGYLKYYEEHPELFTKDYISINALAEIIRKGTYRNTYCMFCSIIWINTKKPCLSSTECRYNLVNLLNSEYDGKLKNYFDMLEEEVKRMFYGGDNND